MHNITYFTLGHSLWQLSVLASRTAVVCNRSSQLLSLLQSWFHPEITKWTDRNVTSSFGQPSEMKTFLTQMWHKLYLHDLSKRPYCQFYDSQCQSTRNCNPPSQHTCMNILLWKGTRWVVITQSCHSSLYWRIHILSVVNLSSHPTSEQKYNYYSSEFCETKVKTRRDWGKRKIRWLWNFLRSSNSHFCEMENTDWFTTTVRMADQQEKLIKCVFGEFKWHNSKIQAKKNSCIGLRWKRHFQFSTGFR